MRYWQPCFLRVLRTKDRTMLLRKVDQLLFEGGSYANRIVPALFAWFGTMIVSSRQRA